jgi:L-aminopeptidase/D-esterase-like protein
LLDPVNTVDQVHGILLAGGSAFGLDAAGGVVRYLEEEGIGFTTRYSKIPIVPAAIIYDLGVGDNKVRPDADTAYQACKNASPEQVLEGSVGVGAGATVGKVAGLDRAMKGGVGTASVEVGSLRVAALAAANSVGDILDPGSGKTLAGVRTRDGKRLAKALQVLKESRGSELGAGENTTLVVVATNGSFTKSEVTKIAQMSHDGMARSVNPCHTPFDGDTVFALATGKVKGADLMLAGSLAAEVTATAIVRAVLTATGLPGLPAHCDIA